MVLRLPHPLVYLRNPVLYTHPRVSMSAGCSCFERMLRRPSRIHLMRNTRQV